MSLQSLVDAYLRDADESRNRLVEACDLLTLARRAEAAAKKALSDLRLDLSLAEAEFSLEVRTDPEFKTVDPATGRVNKDYAEAVIAARMQADPEISSLRARMREAETAANMASLDVLAALDMFTMRRADASVLQAQMNLLAAGGPWASGGGR